MLKKVHYKKKNSHKKKLDCRIIIRNNLQMGVFCAKVAVVSGRAALPHAASCFDSGGRIASRLGYREHTTLSSHSLFFLPVPLPCGTAARDLPWRIFAPAGTWRVPAAGIEEQDLEAGKSADGGCYSAYLRLGGNSPNQFSTLSEF
jgi:hypothetical protein